MSLSSLHPTQPGVALLRLVLRTLLLLLERPTIPPSSRPAAPALTRPVDVLLIDDDLAIQCALGELLEEEGYTVVTAGDGAAALRLLRDEVRPRLILLDLMMPIMSGWQFLEAQRAAPALAALPVVVLSAAELSDHEKYQLHVDLCLRKPIDSRLLFAIVEGYCRGEAVGDMERMELRAAGNGGSGGPGVLAPRRPLC